MINSFRHSTKIFLNYEESDYYKNELKKIHIFNLRRRVLHQRLPLVGSLLDSNLITASSLILYDKKVVSCGNYIQVYSYSNKKTIKNKNKDPKKILYSISSRSNQIKKEFQLKKIAKKNIDRTMIEFRRLCKCNESEFKTFITLTFEENMTDVSMANEKFRYWKDYIKKKRFNDFKYICVPEFQKRGAVHYHLLTNISYDSDLLLDEIKLWNPSSKEWQVGKPLKSWKYGFSMVKNMNGINVVSYLSKYMTKDIDNRLFGHRRYFYSLNLRKPIISYIDSNNSKEYSKLYLIECLYDVKFNNYYFNKYDDSLINFCEYKV